MSSKINAISAGVGGLATSADASGILEIQTNDTTAVTVDGSQVVSFDNNFGTVAGLPSYQCRAWVNFNGTGTVAIRASGNVSSITDNGTGDYTVNFTTAFADGNYAVSGTAIWQSLFTQGALSTITPVTLVTGSVRVMTGIQQDTANAGALIDSSTTSVSIFR